MPGPQLCAVLTDRTARMAITLLQTDGSVDTATGHKQRYRGIAAYAIDLQRHKGM